MKPISVIKNASAVSFSEFLENRKYRFLFAVTAGTWTLQILAMRSLTKEYDYKYIIGSSNTFGVYDWYCFKPYKNPKIF